jgi:hypothetical protein
VSGSDLSHLYEHEHIATSELVEAAQRIGAARYARFFRLVVRGRWLIDRIPFLATWFTNRFYELSNHAGSEHLYTLTPLILAYADQHPDEFFES